MRFRNRNRILIGSIALGLVLGTTVVTPAAAAGTAASRAAGAATARVSPASWSSPVRLATGIYLGMAEVVDSTNHVNIAASGHGGVWYITDRGGTWTKTRVLTNLHNRSYNRVSIALDPNDRVYIAAERSSCDDCAPGGSDGIFLVTDKGRARGTFASVPTKIAPAGSGEPSLKVSHGHIFLADVRFCCMPGPMPPVYLRTNATGSWTQARVAKHGDAPALRIGSDGRARVAFTKPAGIGYAVAHSLTGSFSVSNVPGTSIGANLAGLALDNHDQPHLVWMQSAVEAAMSGAGISNIDANYGWRAADGWHAEGVGPLGGATNSLAFDLDSLGRPRVAAGGSVLKAFVRTHGHWVGTTVATSTDVYLLALRRALNGHAVITYTNFSGGLWVSSGD